MSKIVFGALVVVLGLAAVGCNANQPAAPAGVPTIPESVLHTEAAQLLAAQNATADAIRTEAAQTVVAQLTVDAALNPTAAPTQQPTAVPPTNTPAAPAATEPAAATASVATVKPPTAKPPSGPQAQVTPAYACKVISQSPRDNYRILGGGNFDVTWTVENTGTQIWKVDAFRYQYLSGEQYAKTAMYKLTKEVHPGSRVNLVVDFIAPDVLGPHKTWWKLSTDTGVEICRFNYTVIVDSPTYTVTPTPWY